MSQNAHATQNSHAGKKEPLAPRQRATIPILAGANSVAAAPRMSRVSRRTLHRWLKDEESRQKLAQQANKSGKFNQAQLLHEEIQALRGRPPRLGCPLRKDGKEMNLAALRSRVRALRRKLVLARAQVVLYRMAEEECLEWARAQDQGKTPPEPHDFIQRVVKAGFRLPSFTGVISYLMPMPTWGDPKDQPPDSVNVNVQLYKTLIPWAYAYPLPS